VRLAVAAADGGERVHDALAIEPVERRAALTGGREVRRDPLVDEGVARRAGRVGGRPLEHLLDEVRIGLDAAAGPVPPPVLGDDQRRDTDRMR
jgi:hypothetical protein